MSDPHWVNADTEEQIKSKTKTCYILILLFKKISSITISSSFQEKDRVTAKIITNHNRDALFAIHDCKTRK